MTKEDITKLLWMIAGSYDNFKLDNLEVKTSAWYFDLLEYSPEDVYMGYRVFKSTKGSAFAPTPDEIIACMRVPQELALPSKTEVWSEIRKAIGNSGYHSLEEYGKLSDIAKEIVRSAGQLQEWATSQNYNEGVIQSQVYRCYDEAVKHSNTVSALPIEAKARYAQLQQETLARLTQHQGQPRIDPKREEAITPADCNYTKRLEEKLNDRMCMQDMWE